MKTIKNLKYWKEQLLALEKRLAKAKVRVGEAGVGGDWHENAEYEDAVNQQQLLEVRVKELKKLILNLSQR